MSAAVVMALSGIGQPQFDYKVIVNIGDVNTAQGE